MTSPIRNAQDLGSLVRLRRKQLGYTQARAAELCGTGTRFFSDLENGKETVELGKALAVLATLGMDLTAKTRENEG